LPIINGFFCPYPHYPRGFFVIRLIVLTVRFLAFRICDKWMRSLRLFVVRQTRFRVRRHYMYTLAWAMTACRWIRLCCSVDWFYRCGFLFLFLYFFTWTVAGTGPGVFFESGFVLDFAEDAALATDFFFLCPKPTRLILGHS
jgi:hypothetical protein